MKTFLLLWGLLALTSAFAYDFGIDRLSEANVATQLAGKRLAVLTHAAGVNKQQQHLIDLLFRQYQLKKIFAPEHGLRTVADDWVGDGVDERTGLPVISLYKRGTRAPSLDDLKNIDAIVVDLQDVGVRYYTYFSTIAEVMKVAAQAKIELIILDRPNLLGGTVEGEILTSDLAGSFTAYHTVPTRHGMTLGELARMVNSENQVGAKLTVIVATGWQRESVWDKWERPWVSPSPALVEREQIPLYALWGTLENFNLAVGRGTTNELAFRVIGAPWISETEMSRLADELNALQLAGLRFTPFAWKSTRATHQGQLVRGVKVSGDFAQARSDEMTYEVARILIRLFPSRLNVQDMSARSYGSRHLVDAIRAQVPFQQEKPRIDQALEGFLKRRLPYLLY